MSLPIPGFPMPFRRLRGHAGALLVAAVLSACGGGGSSSTPAPQPTPPGNPNQPPPTNPPPGNPAPRVLSFQSDRSEVFVGDSVLLKAEFEGQFGRLDPDGTALQSGQSLRVGPLDREREFRLVVGSAGRQDAEAVLRVPVRFRDRYVNLPQTLYLSQHAALLADDGSVLLIGGSRGGGALSDRVDRYDPQSGSILPFGQLISGRAAPVATRLPQGQILVTGGFLSGADWRAAELLDERTGQSQPAGTMSTPRTDHAAALLPGGRVLVAGGVVSYGGSAPAISATAEIWEPATRTFRRLPQGMHSSRTGHTMTVLGSGKILIVGGHSDNPNAPLAELFDPATERFTPVESGLPLRSQHAALLGPDGRVLILGGELVGENPQPSASVLRYDPASGHFAELPPLRQPRSQVRATLLPSGQVLLFGGQTAANSHAWSAERYDLALGGQALADMAGERAGHSVTRLRSGRVLVVGGESLQGQFNATVQIYE